MEKNKWFWPLMVAAIFFAAGWYASFAKYDLAYKKEVLAREQEVLVHKKEVLATSKIMLCQFEQVLKAEKATNAVTRDRDTLLEIKHDFGEDTFSMLGGDEKLADAEKAVLLSKIRTQALVMIYDGMAQTADPLVFELGFPRHMGDQDVEASDVI